MAKRPCIEIYPGDWLQGPIAGCSLAAQALWLRLKFIMHGCEPYGYLYPGRRRVTAESDTSHADVTRDNGIVSRGLSRESHADITRDSLREVAAMEIDVSTGTAPLPDRIARMCGVSIAEYTEVLSELDAAGVPRYTGSGIMFDEEMVDAANKRKQWKLRQDAHRGVGGKNVGSHAEIMGAARGLSRGSHADVTRDNGNLSRGSHADVTPMSRRSSSSSSSSKNKENPPLPPALSREGQSPSSLSGPNLTPKDKAFRYVETKNCFYVIRNCLGRRLATGPQELAMKHEKTEGWINFYAERFIVEVWLQLGTNADESELVWTSADHKAFREGLIVEKAREIDTRRPAEAAAVNEG